MNPTQRRVLGLTAIVLLALGNINLAGGTNELSGNKFRVCIKENRLGRNSLPAEQKLIFDSTEIQAFVDSQDGEMRKWDVTTDVSQEDDVWRAVMAKPAPELPWIYITDGRGNGYSGPLPPNIQDTLSLLERYRVKGHSGPAFNDPKPEAANVPEGAA
jgi:hypothetical protein